MSEVLLHFAHLSWRVFVSSSTFLGTTPGGLGAQIVSIAGTEVRGGWWKLSAWKENWPGGLRRVIRALFFVWMITLVVCVAKTVYDDHRNFAGRLRDVVNEKDNLKRGLEARDDYIKRLEARSCPSRLQVTSGKSRETLAGDARMLASDLFDFQGDRLRNTPMRILNGLPGGVAQMDRNASDINHYNEVAVVDFLKKFSGRLDAITQQVRHYGMDTSRLQGHVAELNSIQMMRLIADDLNGLASQLDSSKLK